MCTCRWRFSELSPLHVRQVASLERVEKELIERLRQTQLQQQAAYQELEKAVEAHGEAGAPSSVSRKA